MIIPARNAEATIARVLAALQGQLGELAYEVIVVDSGSTDGTGAHVEASSVVSALLHNPGGEPAGSRNLGARRARGSLLAFTDADCEPAPDWLSRGLAASAGADIVQGRVLPARSPSLFDRTISVGHESGLYETANLFVRREVFERVGGFEPVLGRDRADVQPFGEDAWFVWRARRAGATTTFAPDALVRHAVFPRGARAYVAEHARCRYFPSLVHRIPELRRHLLHRHLFLSPSSARFDLALAGLLLGAAGGRRSATLAAALPYAADVLRDAANGPAGSRLQVAGARVAADTLAFASLASGSIAARTVVL